jgi:hypothetical protein
MSAADDAVCTQPVHAVSNCFLIGEDHFELEEGCIQFVCKLVLCNCADARVVVDPYGQTMQLIHLSESFTHTFLVLFLQWFTLLCSKLLGLKCIDKP